MRAELERLRREIEELPSEGLGAVKVLREALRVIDRVIPSDGCCALTLDPATLLMTGGVHEHGLAATPIRRLLEIEAGEDDVNRLADLAVATSPVGILSRATTGGPETSPRFRDVLQPGGYVHELRMVARAAGRAWGAVVLMRAARSGDFSDHDARLLEQLSEPLAIAVRSALRLSGGSGEPSSRERAVVVLGPRNEVQWATPGARRWLEDLAEIGPTDPAGIPQTLQHLANRIRASAPGEQSRARTRSGQWVTLSASPVEGGEGQVAVVLEASRPPEVASLILEAYGLSAREGELVHHLLHGFDTEQIAEMLGISAYTVQDHLKKIFDKVGVWSRKELVSRIFFAHYLPRMQQNLSLGPDGWFLERAPEKGRHPTGRAHSRRERTRR